MRAPPLALDLFRSGLWGFPYVLDARTRRGSVILSCRCLLLQSLCPTSPAQRADPEAFLDQIHRAPLLGFFSLQRLRSREARFTWVCLTQHVPLSGFFTLSAACFSPTLPGFFHPGTLLGFSLQSLPFRKSRHTSRCPFALLLLAPLVDHGPTLEYQLQGLVPFRSPFTRVWRLAKRVAGALLGFFLFRDFTLPVALHPFGCVPLLGFF